jgi:hypothetical protein
VNFHWPTNLSTPALLPSELLLPQLASIDAKDKNPNVATFVTNDRLLPPDSAARNTDAHALDFAGNGASAGLVIGRVAYF